MTVALELQTLFPHWHGKSDGDRVPWTRRVDLSREDTFPGLFALVAEEQNAAAGSPKYFELAEAMVQDVTALAVAQPEGSDRILLHYFQFEMALGPFKNAIGIGDFGGAHDWIHHGLSEVADVEIQRELHHGRIYDFAFSERRWIRDNRTRSLTDWAVGFYYYCRIRGVMADAAKDLAPLLLRVISALPREDRPALDALGMMLNWAVDHGQQIAAPITARLRRTFNRSRDTAVKTIVATIFATTAGAMSGESPRHWAAWALANGEVFLDPHHRFQLLWQQIETVEDWDRHKQQALDAISAYAGETAGLGVPTAICRATDQRSGLLKPAFHLMNKFERGNDLLEILARWYRVSEATRLRNGALFVCATSEHGTIYLGAKSQLIRRDGTTQIVELTGAANAMLGLTLTIEGVDTDIPLPARPGHPDDEQAAPFEAAINRAYALAELRPDVMEGSRSLVAFPGQPHPLQAMMLAERGASLPITASLETPRGDRPLRRALLWAADNDFYSAFEIDAVADVLAAAGVEIDRRTGNGAVPTDFLDAYANPDFDIVWVAGHGQIDHWRDGSTELIAGENCRVGIDELLAQDQRDGERRLAVFNICDGGASAVNGGIQKLGFAPMLASSRQATISHLWPVNPLIAAAFGVGLAKALADGAGLHAAFDRALAFIRAPIDQITEAVRAVAPDRELAARLENLDIETQAILHWGSPCFFE
mgnify:CR=1 FL=1